VTVSVIIPTCNRAQELERLLKTISNQTRLPEEVIVVDQSDDNRTKEIVDSFHDNNKNRGIAFIWLFQKEKSSAKARNKGILFSSGQMLAFTDDDVVLEKDYLEWITRFFERHPEIGGITGNLKIADPPSGWKWFLRKILLKLFLIDGLNGKMTASGFGYPLFRKEIKSPVKIELMSGYSMNFRRIFIELFDEFFTGYSFREDVDFSYRISKKTTLLAIPQARFEHLPSLDNRDNILSLQRMALRNYRYVFEKHKKRNLFSSFLFAYSVSGIFLIDFIEWLSGFRKQKADRLKADISALKSLVFGQSTQNLRK